MHMSAQSLRNVEARAGTTSGAEAKATLTRCTPAKNAHTHTSDTQDVETLHSFRRMRCFHVPGAHLSLRRRQCKKKMNFFNISLGDVT